ncbi:MAG TPA: HRDC domain-containing protein [Vicinamibacterales bacterium]|nr:HRDC domain-containing protein [Vicinamibacterales bacterium]
MPPALAPPILISDDDSLARLVQDLSAHPIIAVDTESNSLHAYRERVCLIQFSTPAADFIVDPISVRDVQPLARVFANPAQQKVFHAAEGDIIGLRRDYGFEFMNLFDTMSAARSLGWPQVGLAAILDLHFGVRMNKKYQRADWGRRPLTPEQLDYARLDTHYLIPLRDLQRQALIDAGHWPEAEEEFARIASLRPDPEPPSPAAPAFWRVKGAQDLGPGHAAILQQLYAYRDEQARRIDRPLFMVMSDATLVELARRAPRRGEDLPAIPGLTADQIRRHGAAILRAIEQGLRAPAVHRPHVEREPDDVRERYDRLLTWRKERARARGVESDVILPRRALLDLARRPPRTEDDLTRITDLGPWRRQTYGKEILELLSTRQKRAERE